MNKTNNPAVSYISATHSVNQDYYVEYSPKLGAYIVMQDKKLCATFPHRVCSKDPLALDEDSAYQLATRVCAALSAAHTEPTVATTPQEQSIKE